MRRALCFALVFVAGCMAFRPERGHDDVDRLVRERVGVGTGWERGAPEDAQVAQRTASILKRGLTRERAIQIALVQNRELQAVYESLGIAQAELVQAGLLRNPSFSVDLGFGLVTSWFELGLSLVADFVELFSLPLRKRVARAQFRAAISHVASEAQRVAVEVAMAVAAVQAAEQLVAFQRTVTEGARVEAELADRRYEAGNINDYDHILARASLEQAEIDLDHAELERVSRREHINRLLGLFGPDIDWTLAEELPSLPSTERTTTDLESLAIKQRLDLAAARGEVEGLAQAVRLAKTFRFLGSFQIGPEYHRDPDGPRVLGPVFSLELPIFDQRQGLIGRLTSQLHEAERRLAALAVQARSEVRLAANRVARSRRVVERYQKNLVPMRDELLLQAHLLYNGMFLAATTLFQTRQQQIFTRRAYVESLREYWAARAELERAVGGFPREVK